IWGQLWHKKMSAARRPHGESFVSRHQIRQPSANRHLFGGGLCRSTFEWVGAYRSTPPRGRSLPVNQSLPESAT
ncbi:unnamed protein product, partial [Ilex paraguariensis]